MCVPCTPFHSPLKPPPVGCNKGLTAAWLQCGADLVLTLRAEGPPVVQCSSAPMCRMRTFFPAACQAAEPSDAYCPQCTHGQVLTVDFRCALCETTAAGRMDTQQRCLCMVRACFRDGWALELLAGMVCCRCGIAATLLELCWSSLLAKLAAAPMLVPDI